MKTWRGPRVGPRGGKSDEATLVRLLDRIVRDVGVAPDRVHFALTVDTPLHHEALDHAKEANVVEVAVLDQVEEPVCTLRCPVPLHLDHEVALRGGELGAIHRGGLFFERIELEQRWLLCRRAGRGRRRHRLCDLCGWLSQLASCSRGRPEQTQDERARTNRLVMRREHTAGPAGLRSATIPSAQVGPLPTGCRLRVLIHAHGPFSGPRLATPRDRAGQGAGP